MAQEIKLFNTLTRTLERFTPVQDQQVGMYVCGPTVYNYAHLGNLRTFIFEDVLRRALEYFGYQVKQVMNLTDVGHLTDDEREEDRIELGAKREGLNTWAIAKKYSEIFLSDIEKLNITPPDVLCRATDHIAEQIALVKKIEERGCAYVIAGEGVYFDTAKFADYGRLARLDNVKLQAGARVPLSAGKKNITDFALWKFSPPPASPDGNVGASGKKREMEWESPWGLGFPGWHLECSAMALKYLGEQFDIHAGGVDLIPVHHTNEIAQSETATGKKPWVKYWLHGEFMVLKSDEKMAKSTGNFVTMRELEEKGYEPLAFRYFSLNAHYRSKLTFSFEALDGAQNALTRLKERILELKEKGGAAGDGLPDDNYLARFAAAVADDLNTPGALAVFWEMLKDESVPNSARYQTALRFDEVFGLNLKALAPEEISLPREIQEILTIREELRERKKWQEADVLREKVEELGYELEDTPGGPRIKKVIKP